MANKCCAAISQGLGFVLIYAPNCPFITFIESKPHEPMLRLAKHASRNALDTSTGIYCASNEIIASCKLSMGGLGKGLLFSKALDVRLLYRAFDEHNRICMIT